MKKIYLKCFACVIAMGLGMASCGDDSPKNEPSSPVTPVTPSADEALTTEQQKQRMEDVASEFMNEMPSGDFDELAKLFNYCRDNYGEDYNWDNVGDWAEDLWDAAREATGTQTTESHGSYSVIYTNYKSLLLASNFTGHFTARNGGWYRTEANDLQFIFPDQGGRQCVLKLVTSGKVKRLHAFNLDEYEDWYSYSDYYDRTACTIGVPENIEITLTRGNTQMVKTTVKIDLKSLVGEEFDVSKSGFDFSTNVELYNGYKMQVSQVTYSANKQATANFSMTKNGKSLITATVSSTLSGIPSCNVSAFTSDSFDIDDYNTDNANANVSFVKLDILGKMQLQGSAREIHHLVDLLNDAEDNDNNESMYKSCIQQANSLMDIHLFYDGKATKQATMKLEPFVEDSWYGNTYWGTEPVLYFYDGSSYSTFEAFFNENSFKQTIDSFKHLANRYASLVDEHIDW